MRSPSSAQVRKWPPASNRRGPRPGHQGGGDDRGEVAHVDEAHAAGRHRPPLTAGRRRCPRARRRGWAGRGRARRRGTRWRSGAPSSCSARSSPLGLDLRAPVLVAGRGQAALGGDDRPVGRHEHGHRRDRAPPGRNRPRGRALTTLRVPLTFWSMTETWPPLVMPMAAAAWMAASHPATAASTDATSRMSPVRTSTSAGSTPRRARVAAAFAGLRTRATTSWPASSSAGTVKEPTNPVAPVSSTFMAGILSYGGPMRPSRAAAPLLAVLLTVGGVLRWWRTRSRGRAGAPRGRHPHPRRPSRRFRGGRAERRQRRRRARRVRRGGPGRRARGRGRRRHRGRRGPGDVPARHRGALSVARSRDPGGRRRRAGPTTSSRPCRRRRPPRLRPRHFVDRSPRTPGRASATSRSSRSTPRSRAMPAPVSCSQA